MSTIPSSRRALCVGAALLLLAGCAGAQKTPGSTATLVNTYWKLLRLGEAKVTVAENEREPHMILRIPEGGERHLGGHGGCNAMSGGYAVDGSKISFTQLASTMRACAEDAMNTERAFHQALQAARSWAIRGEQLTLLDADGKPIALFESVYLR